MAEEFADFFKSVYSRDPPQLNPQEAQSAAASAGDARRAAHVSLDRVSIGDMRAALSALRPKRSVGPDGIPPFIIKDCKHILAEPLLHVFNLCFMCSYYPEDWKLSRVIPIPKKASANSVSDFRPVAIPCAFAKVLEWIIHRHICRQLDSRITDAQHGFRRGRSTETNLMAFMAKVTPALDAGLQVDVAYFDFRKAFDTVDGDLLLQKFAMVGFTPKLLHFFAAYLRNRRQYVVYEGYTSMEYQTNSGVAQGSVLGPLEFLIFINDLVDSVLEAYSLLFADDFKAIKVIRTVSDCEALQRDIDNALSWSERNKLSFNTSKCTIMTFSRAREPVHYQYRLGGVPLPRVINQRDLGVLMDTKLTFHDHIEKVCAASYRTLGFVMRQAYYLFSIEAIKVLYNAFVRSKLESNAIIWNPHEAKYSLMVEKVQKKFARFLYSKQFGYYPSYPNMYPSLFILGMIGYQTLAVRRYLALVKYVFKLILGITTNPPVLECVGLNAPDSYSRARSHELFALPCWRTNMLRHAPLTRALVALNNIDIDMFTCSLVEFQKAAVKFVESS